MSEQVTILQLASHRLGRDASTGGDFAEAGLDIMGGCAVCGASLAAYNAVPTRGGYWACASGCGEGAGWTDVAEANRDIFEEVEA